MQIPPAISASGRRLSQAQEQHEEQVEELKAVRSAVLGLNESTVRLERLTRRLVWLTVALIVLTAVLVAVTAAPFLRHESPSANASSVTTGARAHNLPAQPKANVR